MRIIILVLICSSCLEFNSQEKSQELEKISSIHVSQSNFSWDLLDHGLIINAPKSSLTEIKSRIALVSLPEQEILKNIPEEKRVIFNVNILQKQRLFSIKPKKSQLEPGRHYGLYTRKESGNRWELKYVFYINYPLPKLLSHDVGEKEPKIISKNRLNFSFRFDQPINITSDQAIKLIGKLVEAPKISQIKITPDKKILNVRLENNIEFQDKETYFFVFDNLLNLDNQKVTLDPIEFIAGEREEILKIIKNPVLDPSNDSAEISWYLNNNHHAELYFGEDLLGKHNCLGQSCPRLAKVMPSNKLESGRSFLGGNYITGLKSNTSYYYVLRAEDHQGQILLSSGVFKTRVGPSLRFSEIFINPSETPEAKLEFIELFFAGSELRKFENLKLIFENSAQVCVLASLENILLVRPGEYVLIVGQEFDEQSAKVPKNAVLLRLPKKQLCGGLLNNKPSFIKLVDDIGMLDHYGAYLWHAPEGLSVIRRAPEGLDEFDNYCYSDSLRGPTPGGPN